jgi:hypothetical protein
MGKDNEVVMNTARQGRNARRRGRLTRAKNNCELRAANTAALFAVRSSQFAVLPLRPHERNDYLVWPHVDLGSRALEL